MTPLDSTRASAPGPAVGNEFRPRVWPRRVRRALLVGVGLGLVALAWLTFAFARIAAGYGATITAMQVFGAGDTLARVQAERLQMPLGLGRFVALSIDAPTHTARARAFGLVTREARWHDGLGAMRVSELGSAADASADPHLSAPPPLAPPLSPGEPWPRGASAALSPLPDPLGAALAAAVDSAFTDPADGAPIATHAVLVVHGGELVAERYAADITRDTRLLGWSMTKSALALLLGRLIALGLAPGV